MTSDDTAEAEAAKAGLAVAPSLASALTSGEESVASVPAADAAVAVVSSAIRRRMYERKEDMRSAVGGAVAIGTRSVSTSMPTPAVEVAVAVAPAMASAVSSREGEAARIVTVEVTGTATSPAVSEGIVEKWEAELSPSPVSR